MDEIFLRDYANNVAVAQDPFGLEAIRAQPGFENYTPSFERTSVVNEPLRGNRAMKAIERDVKRDTQGDVQTYPTGIMAIKPTAQEAQRGNQYSGGKQNTGGAKTGGGGRKSSDFGRDFHG